jgi:hypothetical protein
MSTKWILTFSGCLSQDDVYETRAEAITEAIDYLKTRLDQGLDELAQGDLESAESRLYDGSELEIRDVPASDVALYVEREFYR